MARTWREKALSVSRHYGAGNDEAEDIAQDVMLRLWQMHDELEQYRSVEALVSLMARHQVRNHQRRKPSEALDEAMIVTAHLIIYATGGTTKSRRDSHPTGYRDHISQHTIGKGTTNIIRRNKTEESDMIRYTKAYIKDLLDKYMDGTSTLEEEDILADYFRGKDIPQEWEDYRLLFQEIEAMKPQTKISKRWIGWSMAAAIVAGILYVAVPRQQTIHQQADPLMAQSDTIVQSSEQAPIELAPDTMPKQKEQVQPIQSKKRSIRKLKPTMHDYDKAYALMAQAEQEQRDIEVQLEQAQQEIIEAHLAAYGFIPVKQEDGTIVYINEQTNDIAYEE